MYLSRNQFSDKFVRHDGALSFDQLIFISFCDISFAKSDCYNFSFEYVFSFSLSLSLSLSLFGPNLNHQISRIWRIAFRCGHLHLLDLRGNAAGARFAEAWRTLAESQTKRSKQTIAMLRTLWLDDNPSIAGTED
jgi:hypothetical protein